MPEFHRGQGALRTHTDQSGTAQIRFQLETVIGCPYQEGQVTYDDCSIERSSH